MGRDRFVPEPVMNLSQVIEALLFSAQKPLTTRELVAAIQGAGAEDELTPNEFAKTNEAEVAAALEQLKIEYIEQQRAFQLLEKAEGWQLASDPQFARWVRQLFPAAKPARLTPACARNARDHCLPPADHPGRCRSGARSGDRERSANLDGTRPGQDRRSRRGARAGRCFTRRRSFSSSISACAISMNCRIPRN